jgi:hypothetical protein
VDGESPVKVTLWLVVIVVSLFALPYAVVPPYSTRLSAGWSVVQVTVTESDVILLVATALIIGGLAVVNELSPDEVERPALFDDETLKWYVVACVSPVKVMLWLVVGV